MSLIGYVLIVLCVAVVGLILFPRLVSYYDKLEKHFNVDKDEGETNDKR